MNRVGLEITELFSCSKSKKLSLQIYLGLVILFAFAAPLFSKGIRVQLMDGVSANYENYAGMSMVKISIETRQGPFCFSTHGLFSEQNETARIKSTIRHEGQYLFFRSSTGGNCWRCDGYFVFKVTDKTDYLGYITGKHDHDGNRVPYGGGIFWNIFSALEEGCSTSHAGAPSFMIAEREIGGKLVVDLEATWNENASIRDGALRNSHTDMKRYERHDLLSYIALCKFLGKDLEMKAGLRIAKQSFSAELYKTFECIESVKVMDSGVGGNKSNCGTVGK